MTKRGRRRDRGFTLIDITAAIAVITVVAIVVMQAIVSSRNAARATEELRFASALAQGAFERARSLPPEELAAEDGRRLELPSLCMGRAAALREAALDVSVVPWRADAKLKHVRVVLKWRSCRGVEREVVREGLTSDERRR